MINGKAFAPRPEGGPDEINRPVEIITAPHAQSTREYTPRPEGGPDEIERMKPSERAQLLAQSAHVPVPVVDDGRESAQAEFEASIPAAHTTRGRK